MFTYKHVKNLCQSLTPIQIMAVFATVLERSEIPEDEEQIDIDAAVMLWLTDMLEWTQLLNSDQRTILLRNLRPAIFEYTQSLKTCIEASEDPEVEVDVPFLNIGFVERQWVTCTGLERFFDVDTGEWIDQIPSPPLETLTYSITTLFLRNWITIQEDAREATDGGHGTKEPAKDSAGNVVS